MNVLSNMRPSSYIKKPYAFASKDYTDDTWCVALHLANNPKSIIDTSLKRWDCRAYNGNELRFKNEHDFQEFRKVYKIDKDGMIKGATPSSKNALVTMLKSATTSSRF